MTRWMMALALAVGLAGAAVAEDYDAHTTWVLQRLDGAAFTARATLTFPEAGNIAGRAPCNSYTGPMEAAYPMWETGLLLSTKMACPDLTAEDAFLAALTVMTHAEVAGDTLTLSDSRGREMVFTAGE